jgi:hypothetical protein
LFKLTPGRMRRGTYLVVMLTRWPAKRYGPAPRDDLPVRLAVIEEPTLICVYGAESQRTSRGHHIGQRVNAPPW